jgi:hypothetical protein
MVGYLVTIVNKRVVSALEGIVRSHFTLVYDYMIKHYIYIYIYILYIYILF